MVIIHPKIPLVYQQIEEKTKILMLKTGIVANQPTQQQTQQDIEKSVK